MPEEHLQDMDKSKEQTHTWVATSSASGLSPGLFPRPHKEANTGPYFPGNNPWPHEETKEATSSGSGLFPRPHREANTGPYFPGSGSSSSNLPSTGPNDKPEVPSKSHCGHYCCDFYCLARSMDSSKPVPGRVSEDLPSPRVTSFCGITLNRAQHGQLSEFHVLENDGDTEVFSQEWEAMAAEVGGHEKLASLVKIGLAAVRVNVQNTHLHGLGAETVQLSGFRLTHEMVVTCAHFTDWDLAGNNVQTFLDGQNGICEAIQARGVEGRGHKNDFPLRLWAIHKAWDIAVFRITGWPQNDRMNYAVNKAALYLATPEERRSLATTARTGFWSIGYNAASGLDELRHCFQRFYSRRDDDEKRRIIHRYNLHDANPPGLEFLRPNIRTVSFGARIGHPDSAKENQECAEMSAWYGRSGSMVCAERNGSSVVIGMVQGGQGDSDCNLILFFNTDMREWLDAATKLEESSDPLEISKRIVMV